MPVETGSGIIAHAIQLSIAPVFLLTGIAGLLGVMANRLARIVDRARRFEDAWAKLDADARAAGRREIRDLERRRRFCSWSITFCTTAALMICLVIVTLFVEEYFSRNLKWLAGAPVRERDGRGHLRPHLLPARSPSRHAHDQHRRRAFRMNLRERFGALRNLPPFLALVWRTHPWLTLAAGVLRVVRALLPVAALYVGKLIIDEVVVLTQSAQAPDTRAEWYAQRPARSHRVAARARVRRSPCSRTCSGARCRCSIRCCPSNSQRDQPASDGARGDARPRGLRGQRAAGQAGARAPAGGGPHDADRPALRPGAGRRDDRRASPPASSSTRRGSSSLLVIALVPAFIGEAHFNAQSYSLNYARTPERRELDYVRQTGASVETAKEVKIFGLNAFLIERYRTLADELLRGQRKLARRRAGVGSAADRDRHDRLLRRLRLHRLAHAARRVHDRRSHVPRRLVPPPAHLARKPADRVLAGRGAGALPRRSLLVLRDPSGDRLAARARVPFPSPIREGFVFEDVGFRYPGAERWAVRHLNFALHAGEVLALVGENGAGKTTLVKLLARLYDPDEGRILLDGHDLARVRPLRASRQHRRDLPGLRPLPPDRGARTSRSAASRRATIAHGSSRRRRASLADEVIAQAAERLRPGDRQALPHRHRPVGGRVAEDRDRARLHARRAGADPRRADGRARRARRVRGLPAVQGALQGQDRRADLASLLERAHGRPDRRARRRHASRPSARTRSCSQQGGRYAELFELQAAGYR